MHIMPTGTSITTNTIMGTSTAMLTIKDMGTPTPAPAPRPSAACPRGPRY